MSADTLYQGYRKKLKELDKTLKQLEKQSEEIAEQWDAKSKAEDEIFKLRQRIAYLHSDRSALMGDWTIASFNDDKEKQTQITKRREEIDAEIETCQQEIEQQDRIVADNIPEVQTATETAVDLDVLSTPDVFTFIKELERMLHAEASTLKERIQMARNQIRGYDSNLYDDIRHERDYKYPSSEQKAFAKKQAKNREEERKAAFERIQRGPQPPSRNVKVNV